MRYKFLSVLIIATLLSFTKVYSQDSAFGLKAGVNLANINANDPETSYDAGSGFHAGIFFREKFSKVAIQPEILLSTFNTNATSTVIGDYKDSFTYLSIPLMFKFYLVSGLNIHAGPQFSFLLDGERKGDSRLFGSSSTDIKDYYSSSDVAVSAGAGWDLPFGLSIDARYNIGVKDINDVSNGEEAKSRMFQFSVGWNFIK